MDEDTLHRLLSPFMQTVGQMDVQHRALLIAALLSIADLYQVLIDRQLLQKPEAVDRIQQLLSGADVGQTSKDPHPLQLLLEIVRNGGPLAGSTITMPAAGTA